VSAANNPAPDLVAHGADLEELSVASDGCTACELYLHATQAVFGSGETGARIMLLGEQPGDEEDRKGAPFVGPAGRVLDEAIAEAGLDRGDIYLSNVVKHFRWKPGPKKRLHQKPSTRHIRACRPWLDAELTLVDPDVVVTLGATATQALLGNEAKVTCDHGQVFDWEDRLVVPTIHPSAVLRGRDSEERRRLRRLLVDDLVFVRERFL
jgi:DNA polymerase